MRTLLAGLLLFVGASAGAQSVYCSEANNGNLVMEDVPVIPAKIVPDLIRYQNVRLASFRSRNSRLTA